jgi:hypothetical protein
MDGRNEYNVTHVIHTYHPAVACFTRWRFTGMGSFKSTSLRRTQHNVETESSEGLNKAWMYIYMVGS